MRAVEGVDELAPRGQKTQGRVKDLAWKLSEASKESKMKTESNLRLKTYKWNYI